MNVVLKLLEEVESLEDLGSNIVVDGGIGVTMKYKMAEVGKRGMKS